jgi:hypothetical protein
LDVNGNWGDDDLIDIDADTMLDSRQNENQEGNNEGQDETEGAGSNGDNIFVPPSPGPDPLHAALKQNPFIAGLFVATGDFPKAIEILKKQLAITNFSLLKQIFVDVYTLSKFKI